MNKSSRTLPTNSSGAAWHEPRRLHEKPSRFELGVFIFVLFAMAAALGLVVLSGCAGAPLPGETKAEAKLDTAQSRQAATQAAQQDAASGAVLGAGQANAANPDGLPKAATAMELQVAAANLPQPSPESANANLAAVNAELTGRVAEAQKALNDQLSQAAQLKQQLAGEQQTVNGLRAQVIAERAAAAANETKANDRLCIIAALITGGALAVLAALALAAGLYFTLPKLEYGSAGLGLCAALAFFAATQVGTAHFNLLATLVIFGGVGALVYVVRESVVNANAAGTKAAGFDAAIQAIRNFAGEVATDAETDAKNVWHWLTQELDAAHKDLIADWDKLESFFTGKTATPASQPATAAAPKIVPAGSPAPAAAATPTPSFPPNAK